MLQEKKIADFERRCYNFTNSIVSLRQQELSDRKRNR